jgi:hypothetical protein
VSPLLLQLLPYGLRALKLLLATPKMRAKLAADIAAEGRDVSPDVVNVLAGNPDAIRLLDAQIDEALSENAQIQARLRARVAREGGQP